MKIGMVGLGRMGGNMVRRLIRGGHECVAHDPNPDAVKAVVADGAEGADSLDALVAALPRPRAVWVMVPAGKITDQVVADLGERLAAGDAVIDGGNTLFKDDIRSRQDATFGDKMLSAMRHKFGGHTEPPSGE